jgi:hypothetical protein
MSGLLRLRSGQVPPRPPKEKRKKQIPHYVRDDSRGSGEMFPATVAVLKSSHDPSTALGMARWEGRVEVDAREGRAYGLAQS